MIFLALIFAVGIDLWGGVVVEDLDSLRQRLKALQEAQRDDIAEVKRLRSKERTLGDRLAGLEREVALLRRHIRRLREEEGRLSRQIRSTQRTLDELRSSLRRHQQALGRHLRTLYMYGKPDFLEVLLISKDLPEFWRKVRYIKAVAEWERAYSDTVRKEIESIRRHRAILDARRTARRQVAAQKAERENTLRARMEEIQGLLARLRRDRKARQKVIEERRVAIREAQARIEAYILAQKVQGLGGDFVWRKGKLPWPVEGPVVERFGRHRDPRLGTWTFNRGIGIQVTEGTVVRAVADGEVVLEEWLRGYGQVILMAHGGRYFTLYGGLREVYVREGQKVREGETIGTSGRADALSPPMLHFEILDATEVLDPLKWLKPR